MPMELAEKINEISDIDVFVHDFVDTTNSLSSNSSLDFHPANRRSEYENIYLEHQTSRLKFNEKTKELIYTLIYF